MKLTLETDLNIRRDMPPDMQTVIIDENVEGLEGALDLCGRALLASGFVFSGRLEIVEDEDA